MALLKYLKPKKKPGEELLPDPEGSLSEHLSSEAIREANKEVKLVLSKESSKRSPYLRATGKQKAIVAKYAAENGIVKSIRHFQKNYPDDILKESTVHGWKNAYLRELQNQKCSGDDDVAITELPLKKTGRPLLLDEQTDREVQMYLLALHEAGGGVNCAIARASATGIIRRKNSNWLACNGGHILLTKDWSRYLLERMNFVKRKANTKAKITVDNFTELKCNFLSDIQAVVDMEEVPPCLVINWDHIALKYVPVGSWTMAKEGSKKVPLAGVDDKRQITAVFGATLEGQFLPPQIIYQGKTEACLPRIRFPSDWHVTYTPNHWANELTTLDYIEKTILPYVSKKRKEKGLHTEQRALCIFDNFKAQLTTEVLNLLEVNHVDTVFIPANCTDRLQPLDLSVNKPAKDFLRGKFEEWYAAQIYEQGTSSPITFPLHLMKPLGATWIKELQHLPGEAS